MAALCCLIVWVLLVATESISPKLDFDETETSAVVTNSTKTDDEDVEVKHTIVVSTKLKNNRRGLHSDSNGKDSHASHGEPGVLTYNIGRPVHKQEDSSEVPILLGVKSVESTRIRTPDTRFKAKIYPESVLINRNIRDEFDPYPNSANNPMHWKPSNFFNNINWWNQDNGNQVYHGRSDMQDNRGTVKFHRKITDNGMTEFYCRKCRELSPGQGFRGCG